MSSKSITRFSFQFLARFFILVLYSYIIAFGQVSASSAAGGTSATGASSSSATGSASSSSGSSSSGAVSVSADEFKKAVMSCYSNAPNVDIKYKEFSKGLANSNISSKREAAMFLAQILHESGGLNYTAEIACQSNGCPGSYKLTPGVGKPGKTYYGRGYIQLTWDYNYSKASQALYGDNRLVDDPDQVSTKEKYAWGVSFWFWNTNVHNAAGVQQGQFGAATNAINGPIECVQKSNPTAVQNRNSNYANCLKAFGINDTPDTSGC
jgi:predicted chitinase